MSTTISAESESNSVTVTLSNNQVLLYAVCIISAVLSTCSCFITGMIAICNLKRMKERAAPHHHDPIYETACHRTEASIAMVHNSSYQMTVGMTNN